MLKLTYDQLYDQFGIGYSGTSKGRANFKKKFKVQLNKVMLLNKAIKVEQEGNYRRFKKIDKILGDEFKS